MTDIKCFVFQLPEGLVFPCANHDKKLKKLENIITLNDQYKYDTINYNNESSW